MRMYVLAIAVAALLVLGAAALFIFLTSGSHVASTVRINREIGDVFDFFTTPKNWLRWYPASISVAGATDHSLAIGEEGRRGIPHRERMYRCFPKTVFATFLNRVFIRGQIAESVTLLSQLDRCLARILHHFQLHLFGG